MEKWQKEFWEMMETVADEVERFVLEMTEMVDTFFDLTEELSDQVQDAIASEVDRYLQDLTEPILEAYWELEDIVIDDVILDSGFPYPVEPSSERNPACIGCRHYHGQVYSGELLVCGMHPYGWNDENCPDWEQEEL
jgi:hypothetical protein